MTWYFAHDLRVNKNEKWYRARKPHGWFLRVRKVENILQIRIRWKGLALASGTAPLVVLFSLLSSNHSSDIIGTCFWNIQVPTHQSGSNHWQTFIVSYNNMMDNYILICNRYHATRAVKCTFIGSHKKGMVSIKINDLVQNRLQNTYHYIVYCSIK